MNDASLVLGQGFAQRYLLARFSTGGVVVDLVNGNYFRVNSSAALICEVLRISENTQDAQSIVCRDLLISAQEAGRAIDDVLATLSAPTFRGLIQGPYHFHPADRGYRLWHGDRCVLELDGDLRIRLGSGAESATESRVELYARALAPKLLFQKEVTVLHASACVAAGRLIAFSGLSGAGKTTTARAFRDAGARLLSEDLVVLVARRGYPEMVVEAEGFIHSWARQTAIKLLARPQQRISSAPIIGAIAGATVRLERILFLDRATREGTEFTTSPLAEPDALIALMTHDFLGAVESATWQRFFKTAVTLLGTIDVRAASAPNGLAHLVSSAARYISKTAS